MPETLSALCNLADAMAVTVKIPTQLRSVTGGDAETTGIFTETAGGVTTAVLAKLAERGDIDPSERVVAYITGDGLKTLDAVRGTFEAHEIDATVDSFDAALPAGEAGHDREVAGDRRPR